MLSLVLVDFLLHRTESHISNFFDSSPYITYGFFSHELLQIPKRELIRVLKLTIILAVFLNCVVG